MIAIIFAILIAIIDTGIELDHPVFADTNIVAVSMLLGDTSDNCDHGTGVASIVAQHAPFADILFVKVGAPCFASSTNVARGIRYAVNQGADIISLSYSAPSPSYVWDEAIAYARDAGVTVVASAGNNYGDEPRYPASLEGVIAVGCKPELYAYSNYGAWVDVIAPCEFRIAVVGGSYALRDGTSYATPYWVSVLVRSRTVLPLVIGD